MQLDHFPLQSVFVLSAAAQLVVDGKVSNYESVGEIQPESQSTWDSNCRLVSIGHDRHHLWKHFWPDRLGSNPGTFELMGFFGALVTAFALGYTQMHKAHISVDILVNRFPKKVQRILNALNCIICSGFFAIAGWQISKLANTMRVTGEVTETLRIIYYPFVYGVALGCFLLALALVVELVHETVGANGGH